MVLLLQWRDSIENDGDFRFSSGAAGTNYGGLRGWNTTTGDMILMQINLLLVVVDLILL